MLTSIQLVEKEEDSRSSTVLKIADPALQVKGVRCPVEEAVIEEISDQQPFHMQW